MFWKKRELPICFDCRHCERVVGKDGFDYTAFARCHHPRHIKPAGNHIEGFAPTAGFCEQYNGNGQCRRFERRPMSEPLTTSLIGTAGQVREG